MLVGYCHGSVLDTVFPHMSRNSLPTVDAVVRAALHGVAP
jgi:hypothetical protein